MNDLLTIDTPVEELEKRLLSESDSDEIKNIIDIFNLNIKKKNVIRTEKLSQLQDAISEQMKKRIESSADAFSNKDLLDYFKTIQETVDKSDMSSEVKVPVQINQINIDTSNELDRASKEKVLTAINAILSKQNNKSNESVDYVDVVESNEEENNDR